MEQNHSAKYIYDIIRSSIENGIYVYGQPIPPERTLADLYLVSRMTIRKATDLLVNEGLLYRKQGKGTFVSLPRLHASNAITSTKKYLEDNGLKPSANVFYTGIRTAGYKYGSIFQIDEHAQIYQLFRQRLGDGIPYTIEYSYLPLSYVPNIEAYDFAQTSLYLCLKDNGITLSHSHQTLDLVLVNQPQSTLLAVPDGTSAFMRKSTIYDINDRAVEYTLSYSVAEKYVFKIS